MTVAHDASSFSAAWATATAQVTAHTPVGTPRGVAIRIVQSGSGADEISDVTYGGVAMTRVRFTARTVTETGAVYLYFLGSNVPTGVQDASVTSTGTTSKRYATVTVTADRDTVVDADNGADAGIIANPSLTLDYSDGRASWMGYYAIFSGLAAPVTTVAAGDSHQLGHDFGAASGMWSRKASSGSGGNSTTMGYTAASDDVCHAGLIIAEAPVAGTAEGAVTAQGTATGLREILGQAAGAVTAAGTAKGVPFVLPFHEDFDAAVADGTAITVINTNFTRIDRGEAVDNGTVEFDTAQKVTGDKSMRAQSLATDDSQSYGVFFLDDGPRQFLRFYVYPIAYPAIQSLIVQLKGPGGSVVAGGGPTEDPVMPDGIRGCALSMTTTGQLRLRDQDNNVLLTNTTALSLDAWARVEMMADTTNDVLELRVFTGANLHGTTPDETRQYTTYTFDTSDWYYGQVGLISFANGGTVAVDAIATSPTDWVGPATISVTGTAQSAVAAVGAATGVREVFGSAQSAVAAVGTAAGVVERFGQAQSAITAAGAAQGIAEKIGQASSAIAAQGVASGQRTVFGQASSAIDAVGTASGQTAGTVVGSGQSTVAASGHASGVVDRFGQAAGAVAAQGAAQGFVEKIGQASSSIAAVGTAIGQKTVVGQAHGAVAAQGSASGVREIYGVALGAVAAVGAAVGTATTPGAKVVVGSGAPATVGTAAGSTRTRTVTGA